MMGIDLREHSIQAQLLSSGFLLYFALFFVAIPSVYSNRPYAWSPMMSALHNIIEVLAVIVIGSITIGALYLARTWDAKGKRVYSLYLFGIVTFFATFCNAVIEIIGFTNNRLEGDILGYYELAQHGLWIASLWLIINSVYLFGRMR